MVGQGLDPNIRMNEDTLVSRGTKRKRDEEQIMTKQTPYMKPLIDKHRRAAIDKLDIQMFSISPENMLWVLIRSVLARHF